MHFVVLVLHHLRIKQIYNLLSRAPKEFYDFKEIPLSSEVILKSYSREFIIPRQYFMMDDGDNFTENSKQKSNKFNISVKVTLFLVPKQIIRYSRRFYFSITLHPLMATCCYANVRRVDEIDDY